MSSTVSTTDLKTIPRSLPSSLKMEESQPRLVRSTSIEKIKRFNTFICTQQYYILPALLTCLKSSQPNLQTSTENTILIFRSVIFNSFFYKMFMSFRTREICSKQKIQSIVEDTITCTIPNFYKKFTKCFESTFLLVVAVYMACALILGQLIFSLYLIHFSSLPNGLIFLMASVLSINYIGYKTMSRK